MKIKLQFGELNITPSVEERLDDLGFTADSFASDVSDHKSDCDGNPSIYCGTWAKYNDGNLTGLWIDLTTFDDFEDFINFCKGIHADEVTDEVAWLDKNTPNRTRRTGRIFPPASTATTSLSRRSGTY